MSWLNNSFNSWKSRYNIRDTQHLWCSVSLLLILLIILIVVCGCTDGGTALDGFKDAPDPTTLGENNTMNNESSKQKDVMPVIDQNIPARLETATLALG